jgi:glutathione synthase/RimK-type ligase-like ATP-grasp enzyme
MNVLLRRIPEGEPSATRLLKRLKELGVDINIAEFYEEINQPAYFLIRWGSRRSFPLERNGIEINTSDSIYNGDVNKPMSRKLLQERGIPVPKSFFSKYEILHATNVKYPLIGRQQHHGQGTNIEFIKNSDQVINSNSKYWSEFIPKEREFRIYVFGNKAIGVAEKIPKDKKDIAWNSHLGSTFIDVPDNEWNKEAVHIGIAAAKEIGQHFSGVDLMEYKDRFYVLEVNTAIALSNPHRVDIFAQAFKDAILYHWL